MIVCDLHPGKPWHHGGCKSRGRIIKTCRGFADDIGTISLMFGCWWLWIWMLSRRPSHPGHPWNALRHVSNRWSNLL